MPHAPYENEVTVSASDYDGFADAYSAEDESGLFNAYYERPAMLRTPATSQAAGSSTQGAVPGRCRQRFAPRAPSSPASMSVQPWSTWLARGWVKTQMCT